MNLPSGFAFCPETTVCGWLSLFVQVTVSPTLAFTGSGEKASVVLVDAPETILTGMVAPPPPPPVVAAGVVALVPVALAVWLAEGVVVVVAFGAAVVVGSAEGKSD